MTDTLIDRRRQLLQQQSALNGIDHVEVVVPPAGPPATQLLVTFVNPLAALPTPDQVRVVGGDRIPTIVGQAVAAVADPSTILVTLAGGGDLSLYTLQLVAGPADDRPPSWVDPVLATACFSFALDCGSDLPCDATLDCPPAAFTEPALDYLARDWESLRLVLLDRMAVLQPAWTERNPADVRIALIELLAELGDRASYQQDAIATEAYLGTARRRISVRRHARLVDYTMSDGTNARTWVRLVVPPDVRLVSGGKVPVLAAGTRLLTGSADAPAVIATGSPAEINARRAGALEFETMEPLFVVAGAHDAMRFHTWSGAFPVLCAGATSATLLGHLPDLAPGQVLILAEHRDPVGDDKSVADADPTRRQAVRLTDVRADADDGAGPRRDPLTGEQITEVAWHDGDALAFPLLIAGELIEPHDGKAPFADGALAHGNVVLVDHGHRQDAVTFGPVPPSGRFAFGFPNGPLTQVGRQIVDVPLADGSGTNQVVRAFDPNASAAAALSSPPVVVLPDATLVGRDKDHPHDAPLPWTVQRDLLSSSTNRDVVVEVDDEGIGWLRFGRAAGDSAVLYGQPLEVGQTITASYRIGNGVVGNIGAGAIHTILVDDRISAPLVAVLSDPDCSITNPLPAVGGTEPETLEQVRQRAPFAFRTQQRAVTAADYADRAAQFGSPGPRRVQRAVATIRWTGSWHVVVVAVDPVGTEVAGDAFLAEVAGYLDQFRMAGHDLQVVAAQYAALEVGLHLHVAADHRRDLVVADVLATMSNRRLPDGRLGLFHPDRMTFGAAVYLSPIVAAAQSIPGVLRVEATRFSRYRLPGTDARASGRIDIGPREIARLDNDPNHPERGRFVLDAVEGGR